MRPPVPLSIDDPVLVNAVLVRVPAGFPSPAQDSFDDGRIDLNEVLIRDVTSTYLFRVTGDSMEGVGIYSGDEVLVDRSLTPRHGSVVIAVLDGDFTIKTLHVHPDRVVLHPENPAYPDVEVPSLSELVVWGVVVYGIRHINQQKYR
ncbi:LexA family protein [Kocuria sp. CPCC 205263]|uniref:LexA family protein n=1 Tax=Kocuria sp. CPCC 205263 TaxID=3073555 RepID=UPI0034D79E6C